MSKSHKKIDPNQIDIFSLIRQVSERQAAAVGSSSEYGKYNIDIRLRGLLSAALKSCPLSREEVAGKMSELLGVTITKEQLDSWTAESKDRHRFPYVYGAAFCSATGDRSIVRILAELVGGYFIESEDAIRLELGKIEEQKQRLDQREKAIREFLKRD